MKGAFGNEGALPLFLAICLAAVPNALNADDQDNIRVGVDDSVSADPNPIGEVAADKFATTDWPWFVSQAPDCINHTLPHDRGQTLQILADGRNSMRYRAIFLL
ncbi:MAG: hypothetical protein V7609_73 [Verrucomicrobiota bacterium]